MKRPQVNSIQAYNSELLESYRLVSLRPAITLRQWSCAVYCPTAYSTIRAVLHGTGAAPYFLWTALHRMQHSPYGAVQHVCVCRTVHPRYCTVWNPASYGNPPQGTTPYGAGLVAMYCLYGICPLHSALVYSMSPVRVVLYFQKCISLLPPIRCTALLRCALLKLQLDLEPLGWSKARNFLPCITNIRCAP